MAEISRYPNKRAACVSALKIVQRYRGWVSDEIRDIADLLEMSVEELDGVATFFSHIYTRAPGQAFNIHLRQHQLLGDRIRQPAGAACGPSGYKAGGDKR